ncbi:Co2+/Mg2+ efflux protein ApaG [Thiohalomonas denitrificans]|uniref:Protein ApaG n=1 Tax=Thiohalomonas denitrificans TaxID=415747 RepID=A0A1G5QA81_9GAMM|nr:Co2+/Mg2+ efflux protein ApaG [Thiohalomonas denitrificans]SCZ58410.1 ApaG protein [Thiohalomonas denitrificans]
MESNQKIDVNVEAHYVEDQSFPEQNRYAFAYTITIRNNGERPARLVRRHWEITDGQGRMQEVDGEGVVGEQPYLRPGEAFRYTSGVILETPVGSMEGHYRMIDDDQEEFDADVPPFTLALPHTLH